MSIPGPGQIAKVHDMLTADKEFVRAHERELRELQRKVVGAMAVEADRVFFMHAFAGNEFHSALLTMADDLRASGWVVTIDWRTHGSGNLIWEDPRVAAELARPRIRARPWWWAAAVLALVLVVTWRLLP